MKFLLLIFFIGSLSADAHIFVYHRFGDTRHPSTSVSLNELQSQFEYFKTHNYEVVPLSKIVNKIKTKQQIPTKWIALSIDDSYKSFYTNGLKLFKKYKYPFTIFVYIKATDDNYSDFMNWEQLREVKKYGDIQYHSYRHSDMVKDDTTTLQNDFKIGMNSFYKNMGYLPKYFVYPYGKFNSKVTQVTKSFGFEAIFNQNIGAVSKNSNIYDIDRNALTSGANHKYYLRLKELIGSNILEPKIYPKSGILKKVKIKVPTKYKNIELYISGGKWEKVKPKKGIIEVTLNRKLNNHKKSFKIVIKSGNYIKAKMFNKD